MTLGYNFHVVRIGRRWGVEVRTGNTIQHLLGNTFLFRKGAEKLATEMEARFK